ncbi:ribosome biogenesis GTPase YlqF [Acetivibrio sp. MSJd-27]|uniref:ribosome biogenesis GTPase YlqF n=1 Tax=Acetivibrio sp. MSJd-27 TaxID=2841523 RepID=UPI0015A9D8B7|nr:ribosome biogenesis GTPase YlqF [Acetivibrio sp. MSJd-27]MBU5450369.1 ribosome biogenesis GTPase YlqF [Acetivibrio sp. MSJd-27]
MNINWFPGHMAKTRRLIQEHLKLVDVVVEIRDARIPASSGNPMIEELLGTKPRVILLNKYDMADDEITQKWISYFQSVHTKVLLTDSISGKGLDKVVGAVKSLVPEKMEKYKEKGMRFIPKMMVVGVPNVGKSSFINKLTGKSSAKTGDKPGVTTAKQWIRIQNEIELLDTPGILWPKFEEPEVGQKLAFTRAIKDEILDIEELCFFFLKCLIQQGYQKNIEQRYKIEIPEGMEPYALMEMIGKKRGFVIRGGEIDMVRTANTVMDEYQSGMLGKITLEKPEDV